ncbi:MAG: DUF169 domain-containing protein [Geothermobacteraceae bacterium]
MNELLQTLVRTVNPKTAPVGVSLLEDLAPLAEARIRLRGKQLAVCQQIAYSRYYRWSTLVTAAESHCVLGASCTGLVKAPERVLSGEVNTGVYQKDREAAARMQQQMPRVERSIAGVLTWPLDKPVVTDLVPDAVVIYGNTAQAMRFVQAFLWQRGGEFVMRSSGDAGVCSRGVAQVVIEGEPVIEIPCLGDRRFAMTQDDEMIIAFPGGSATEVIEGLEATHKAGIRYPIPFQIPERCGLPETFTTGDADRKENP